MAIAENENKHLLCSSRGDCGCKDPAGRGRLCIHSTQRLLWLGRDRSKGGHDLEQTSMKLPEECSGLHPR